MNDFKKELIAQLEKSVPDLKDKVQAGAVDAETPVPYAAFTVPEETPIRTIHGIAGTMISFDLAIYHNKMSSLETLKGKVLKALDLATLAGKRCYYKSSEYGFYPDFNIHGYTLNFRIV